jgi:hypothetical protein
MQVRWTAMNADAAVEYARQATPFFTPDCSHLSNPAFPSDRPVLHPSVLMRKTLSAPTLVVLRRECARG